MSKLILVTGASRGLGLEITRRLATEAYQLVSLSRTCPDELKHLCDTNDNIAWEAFDLADTSTFQSQIRGICKQFGPVFGLVNNAAIAHDGILATQHDSEIIEQINVNVTGTILLTKYASRTMLPQRTGRVINIASIIAFTGYNGLAVYAATKASMIGFSRSFAREMGRSGVTVNAIAPGYMKTSMTQGLNAEQLESIKRRSALQKLCKPEDVAGAVAYLLGPDGESITGTTITIDAGSTA